MDRRWFLATLAGVGVGVGGRALCGVDGTVRTTAVENSSLTALENSSFHSESTTNLDEESAGRLRGTRSEITDRISLTKGVTTLDVTYSAESTISLTLIGDEMTDGRQLAVDRTGRAAGTVFLAERGEYRIEVATTGPWEIRWAQPVATNSETSDSISSKATLPPQRASGTGPAYIGPLRLARTTELTLEHTGEGPIAVTAYTARSDRTQLFDVRGETETWTTTDLNGVVWFDIAASGAWTLDIS